MIRSNKIEGSAMQYAIVIVTVMALLLGGFVLYAGMSLKLQTRFNTQDRLRDNAQSGLEYGKASIFDLNYDQTITVNLFNSDVNQVRLTKRNWGAYDYLVSEVKHHNFKVKMMEMVGNYYSKMPFTLYLSDRGTGLSLSGKTIIKGKVRLPKKGVKRAYIEGHNFLGDQLIDGVIEYSENQLPELNHEFLDQLQKPYLREKLAWENIDSLHQSFYDPPIYYSSNQSISIQNSILSGQIVIESADSIFIAKTAQLTDVIIKAPVIYIESGFTGSLQLIASHKITISDNVTLLYPSVLGLIETHEHLSSGYISIGEGSKVIGSVFTHSAINNYKKELFLNIAKKAEIHGLAYSNGSVQLKGEVNGSLATKKFFLKTASSVYENHLFNASITNHLPDNFCVVPLFQNNYQTTALKCLN